MDRLKHIFKLAQGEYISPERIEQIYSQSPFIYQIYVDGSPLCNNPVALVVPDGESVCKTLSNLREKSTSNIYFPHADHQSVKIEKMPSRDFYLKGKLVTLVELCNNSEAEQLIINDIIKLGKSAALKGFEQVSTFSS